MWASYARVSSDEQANETESIQHQLAILHRWMGEHRFDYTDYVDAGESGWTDDPTERPAFARLLADVRAHAVDGVAAVNIDRFSRSLIVTVGVAKEFARLGVRLHFIENGELNANNPDDLIRLMVHGGFAEYYSADQSRKIKRGLLARAQQGLHVGTTPFGYCNGRCPGCDKTCERFDTIPRNAPMILHPADAPGVLLAYNTYRGNSYSDAMIAKVLNDANYRSRTRQGRAPWNKHSIAWLLTNRTYTGKVVFKGQVFPGQHPAIISDELFEEVQMIRRAHYHGAAYTPKYRVYLFNGIILCAGCWRKMRAVSYGKENRYRGYRCTTEESAKAHCAKPQTPTRAERLEEPFAEMIRRFHLPKDWRARVLAQVNHRDENRHTESERRTLKEQAERLKWLYVRGDLKQDEYLREKQALEHRLPTLIAPRQREVLDAGAYLETLSEVWNEATPLERREMVHIMLSDVVCDPETKRLIAFSPRPVFLPLFRHLGLTESGGRFLMP